MKNNEHILEVSGYIRKQERLSNVGDNILQNTTVLESLQPFPGYHGSNLPDESHPRSIFILLSKEYGAEEMARKTKAVKSRFDEDFNASEGVIYISPYEYPCLRIKHLPSFHSLPELQMEYQKEGLKFYKEKAIENQEAIIQINKVFQIYEKSDGIYQDAEHSSKCYIEIPEALDWEIFKKITHTIKNNLVKSNFDAAQGIFFRAGEIVDVVRVYDLERKIEKKQTLRNMYLEEIRRLHK